MGNTIRAEMSPGSRRWRTLTASLVASLCVGFGYAWSVLMRPMAADHGWTVAQASLSFTVIFVVGALAALSSGKALQYLRPRTLLLIGGALFGAGLVGVGSVSSLTGLYAFAVLVGFGLGTVCPGATMSNSIRFFPDKRGLASGLLIAGYGLGAVVWAPVAVFLIGQYGLTWTLRLLGVAFFAAIAVCSLFVRTATHDFRPTGWSVPAGEATKCRQRQEADWRGMLRARAFWALAALFVMGTLGGNLVVGLASPIAQQTLGVSPQAAADVVSILALGLVAGKLAWGWVSDRLGRYPVFAAMFALGGGALLLMAAATRYAPLVAEVTTVGFCYGGFLALIGPSTADAFGPRHLPINYGVMFLTVGVSALLGPRLGAMVLEARGSYAPAFVFAAGVNVVGLSLAIAQVVLARRRPTVASGTRSNRPAGS
jgi:OFA family oxalate/formate antiporter-like MFS transporter